jgi:hypothetical protein
MGWCNFAAITTGGPSSPPANRYSGIDKCPPNSFGSQDHRELRLLILNSRSRLLV